MMRTLAQTGNGWMTFKDASNRKSNQTGKPENVIHLSNLCTEILEVTNDDETAVCNLGSINVARYVKEGKFDFDKLRENVGLAVRQLDRVIDLNFYTIQTAKDSNMRWRNIGLGLMGLQDVFFQLRLPFDCDEARKLAASIQEEIYFAALDRVDANWLLKKASMRRLTKPVLHREFSSSIFGESNHPTKHVGISSEKRSKKTDCETL
jgi:ribonucleoside-diphosphate reductase alpha chain